jgi:hypothetical protein
MASVVQSVSMLMFKVRYCSAVKVSSAVPSCVTVEAIYSESQLIVNAHQDRRHIALLCCAQVLLLVQAISYKVIGLHECKGSGWKNMDAGGNDSALSKLQCH